MLLLTSGKDKHNGMALVHNSTALQGNDCLSIISKGNGFRVG
jgi:hypothetical protein